MNISIECYGCRKTLMKNDFRLFAGAVGYIPCDCGWQVQVYAYDEGRIDFSGIGPD